MRSPKLGQRRGNVGDLRLRGFLDYTRDMICVNDSALSLAAGASDGGAKAVSSS